MVSVSVSAIGVGLSSIPSVGRSVCLSVCLSVRKVYCDKTADWIRMPFGMVSGVGRWLGVLDGDGGGDRRRGRAVLVRFQVRGRCWGLRETCKNVTVLPMSWLRHSRL